MVPLPVIELIGTVQVVPEPVGVPMVPLTPPVFVKVKSLASTPVTAVEKVTV